MYRVDYKIDRKAADTGNLALEHISVLENGQRKARGWIHTSIADLLVVYVPGNDVAYVLELKKLRQWWPEIERNWPLKPTSTIRDDKQLYETWNYCVQIRWLMTQQLIERIVRAVGVQLRLHLTTGAQSNYGHQTKKHN